MHQKLNKNQLLASKVNHPQMGSGRLQIKRLAV